MNIFDILIIIILIWGSYKGFRRGLLKSLGGILSWIIGLFVALNYNDSLANYMDKQFSFVNTFGQVIKEIMPLPSFSFEANNISLAIISVGIEEMALPDFIKKNLMDNISQILQSGEAIPATLPEIIGLGIASMILKGLAFVVLFLITGALIKIGINFISNILGVTLLGPINKLAGMVLGLFVNIIVLAVLIGVLSPIIIVSASQGSNMAGIIQSSKLFTYFLEIFAIISNYVLGLNNI